MYMKKSWISVGMRLSVILVIAGISLSTVAQSVKDTVLHIPDVVVSASRSEYFREDIRKEEFGTDKLSVYSGESLSRLLTEEAALNIRSYGVGGAVSTIALRGASSSQVQVNWNGFPINSVTVGSCDLSMVPAAGFDRVSLVYGASGALYGSGTFGGAVELKTELKTEKKLDAEAYLNYQSLMTINGGITVNAGNDKIAWKLSSWGASSENEFKYYDYINQYQRWQRDGGWKDHGVIQGFAWKISPSSALETGLWYEVKSYDIPSRIGSTTYEHQSDSALRVYLGYKYFRNRWSIKIKTARFQDRQNYWQKASAESTVNSIDSRIASVQYYGDANLRYYMARQLSFDFGLTGSWTAADVSAYGERRKENGIAAFTGVKYSFRSLTLQTTLRREWSNSWQSGLLPSFGASWEVINDRLKLRTNYSQKFRKPTFNDLFWMPGGDSNLKPERGYTAETGSEITLWQADNNSLKSDVSVYYTHINDMIVWRQAGAYWSAMNYQEVSSRGIDIGVIFNTDRPKWDYHSSLKITLNHSLVSSSTDEEGIMLYSPRIITSWENRIVIGIFDLTVWHHFTSDRYYDEGRLLDPYSLLDIRTGAELKAGKGILGIHIAVNNLENTTYELIRLYPMPGRYWSVKMKYQFK